MFTQEARNCAALDTCCSSSVAGKEWLEMYLDALSEDKLGEVRGPLASKSVFSFGNNGRLPSEGKYFIPAILAGNKVDIEMDVVKSNIPLLLSKKAMKKVGMKIDMTDDTVIVFGKKEKLATTSNGLYAFNRRF